MAFALLRATGPASSAARTAHPKRYARADAARKIAGQQAFYGKAAGSRAP
jgi:hypothetical protein